MITKIAQRVFDELKELFPEFEPSQFEPDYFEKTAKNTIEFRFRGWYFKCDRQSSNQWICQETRCLTKKGKPNRRYFNCLFGELRKFHLVVEKNDLKGTAYFQNLEDAIRACVFYSFSFQKTQIDRTAEAYSFYSALVIEKQKIIHQKICPHFTREYFEE